MPFDSTTFAPAKADPLDLDAMIAWLETMPAEGVYWFEHSKRCLLTQFFEARHATVEPGCIRCRADDWSIDYRLDGTRVTVPNGWFRAVNPGFGRHTYGAALSRFRALREAGQ